MGMMGRKSLLKVSVHWLLAFALLFIFVAEARAEDDDQSDVLRLYEVHQYIQKYHVSGIDGDVLANEAIRAMIELLDDPHTVFYTREEYESFTNSIEQNYVGIGIRVSKDDYGFIAVEVFADSPAQKAGMMEGDYILSVDGVMAHEWDLDQLVERIKGPEDSIVELMIERFGETMTLQMERKSIQVPLVTSEWFPPGIGYIQFSSFSSQAEKDFAKHLAELQEKQLQGLILDLRGNPGGYLHIAEKLAKHFIPEGTLVYMRDRDRILKPLTISEGSQIDVPIAILVNEGSASASEIFASSMRDHGLAILIGTNTYGKGSVQQLIELSDGSYLKLTIEEYLTPNKEVVDGVGLQPDLEVHGSLAQFLTAFQRMNPNRTEIEWAAGNWKLNEVSMGWPFPVWNQEDSLYIPLRIVAALAGQEVEWNGEIQAVIMSANDEKSVTFQIGSEGVELLNGITFISMERLKQTFPAWKIHEDVDRFHLIISE